jgi:hypothetical protein
VEDGAGLAGDNTAGGTDEGLNVLDGNDAPDEADDNLGAEAGGKTLGAFGESRVEFCGVDAVRDDLEAAGFGAEFDLEVGITSKSETMCWAPS